MAGQKSSVAGIVVLAVAAFMLLPIVSIGVITLFGSELRGALVGPEPEEGDAPPARVQVEKVDGQHTLVVDWDLQPGPSRKRYSRSVPISVRIEGAPGRDAKPSEVLVLWGPWFGARAQAQRSLEVFPSAPGRPRAFVQHAEGAAELPCYRGIDPSFPDRLQYSCMGELTAGGTLRLPPAPSCPDSPLAELYRRLSPGACLGLTAVELSRLPLHLTVRPSPEADVVELRSPLGSWCKLSGPVGMPLDQLETVGNATKWAEIAPLLAKALGPARPATPTASHHRCPETPRAEEYGGPSGPGAHVEICEGFRLTLRAGAP